MNRYSQTRRELRGRNEFVLAPRLKQQHAKSSSLRLWGIALVLALVLGAAPFVIARAIAQTLWGAA